MINQPIEPNDYRPISILPILSKVYEKVLLTQLNQHIENNQLLSTHQSGFQKGHCTISTCMKIKEDIVKAMNRGEITLAVMADFSKVFDTVDFETLIQKLHQLNLSKSSLKIFASYLSNRHQYVQIDDRAAFLVQCFLLSTCMTWVPRHERLVVSLSVCCIISILTNWQQVARVLLLMSCT